MHHGDPRRHRHRLDLVVGDIDDGGADALMQPLDLHPHLDAQLGVEIGERFVEQEQQRIAHQSAAHRHALALAAGQLRRLATEQRLDLQQPGHICQRRLLLRPRHMAAFHSERDVLAHRHRWIERIGLEHHGDVAVLWRDVIDDPSADFHGPRARAIEPGDDVEQRGLAAAGRPDQHGEFTALDVEIDPLQHLQIGVPLRQGANAQRCHDNPIISRPPQ